MSDADSAEHSRLERLLGQAWDALPMAAFIVDQEGAIRHCNEQTRYLLGYEPDQLVGEQVERLMAKTQSEASGDSKSEEEAPGTRPLGGTLEFYVRRRNESAVPVRLSLTQIDDTETSDEVWTLVLMQDQRPYLESQKSSSEVEKRYWQLFNQDQVGLVWARLDGKILYCNPAAAQMFGFESPEDFEGESFREYYRGEAEERRQILDRLRAEGEVSEWNVPMERRDGSPFTILENLVLYEDTEVDSPVIVSNFVEVTEQARLWKELKEMAYHDPLTGLPNRRFLKEQSRKVFALVDRRDRYAGVAYIDLDGFKAVNDQWGHQMGDEVLVAVAERLQRSTRESDVVARIGGDEFAVLWADLDEPEGSVTATRRIMNTFEEPFKIGGKVFSLDLSAGIAQYPSDGDTVEELLRYADQAMYRAKEEGKEISTEARGRRPTD